MTFCRLIGTLLAIGIVVACSGTKPDQKGTMEADIEAIDWLHEEFDAAVNAGDLARLIALYDQQVVRLSPNSSLTVGREAAEARWEALFDQFIFSAASAREDLVVSDEWAFYRGLSTGTMTPKSGGEPRTFDNKYVSIARRQPDGSFKIWWSISNSNLPQSGPVEP